MESFKERMQKRQEELRLKRETYQKEMEETKNKEESTEYFQKQFNHMVENIQASFNDIRTRNIKDKDQLKDLNELVSKTSQYVTESSYFLTSFDHSQSIKILQDLSTDIANYSNSLFQKKFSFGSLHNNISNSTRISISESPKTYTNNSKVSNDDKVETHEPVLEKQVIRGYTKDQDIKEELLSATLTAVNSSIIFLHNINGSIYIENCHNSIFIIRGRQLRIHDSSSLFFSLYMINGPIFENCNDFHFVPFPQKLLSLYHDCLSELPNHFDEIKDFNWLKTIHSPNFSSASSSSLDSLSSSMFSNNSISNKDIQNITTTIIHNEELILEQVKLFLAILYCE
ncbi:hypothetical protein WA158_003242 [Blastocystis sp. Blastoise]